MNQQIIVIIYNIRNIMVKSAYKSSSYRAMCNRELVIVKLKF